ncbi:MAG: hypothetical protein JWP51_2668 [Bradyrhizobium sp.]|jgi:hypothetical protein|nr:hypothetical protein [Bradyrhizobium sp.]
MPDNHLDNIVRLPTQTRGDYFGGCPICHMTNGFLNSGSEHWFVCDVHRVKWYVGSNLFSGWREETAEQRFRSLDKLTKYREVEAAIDDKSARDAR